MSDKAVVVLSGGQDSTTCLWWAMERFGRKSVAAITFDYGQRHRIERDCAATIAAAAGIPHIQLPIDTFEALGGNALTDEDVNVSDFGKGDLPATFVPGRNLIFLTFAAAWAWPRGVRHIVTGVAQTDFSGYPDCRQQTIDALASALALGMESDYVIHTPLMNLSKKETVLLARDRGAIEAMGLTHTCYEGQRQPCGECQACILRAKGFSEAGIDDPLLAA